MAQKCVSKRFMSNGLRPSALSWSHCQPVYQMPPNARPTLACLVRSRCLNGCHWDPRDHLASRRRIRKLEKNGCISCVSAHILWVSSGKWPIDIYKSKSNLPCDAGNHFVFPGSAVLSSHVRQQSLWGKTPLIMLRGSKSAMGMVAAYQWQITWACVRLLPSAPPPIVWTKQFRYSDTWQLTSGVADLQLLAQE